MSILKNPFTSKNILLITGDAMLAIASVYAAVFIRFSGDPAFAINYTAEVFPKAVVFSIFVMLMCFFIDLYSVESHDGRKEVLLKVGFAVLFAAAGLAAFYYFVPYLQMGRGIFFYALLFTAFLQSLWHIGYGLFLKLPVVAKKVLILGTGPIAEKMGNLLQSSNNGLAFSGYVNCVNEPLHVPEDYVVGNGEGLLAIATKQRVQKIVVSLTERRGTFPVREVLNCKLKGIDIVDGPSFYEQMTGKLLIENMNPSHLIFSDGFRITIFRRYLKRMFDVFLASAGIVFSMPFVFILPALIKLDSRGPVLFKQERMGEGEKVFTLYKFRTMVDGAEKDTGPVWSQADDHRVTSLGRFMRKTRLDEIPQLFNVICGDMSFIGPRPERPFFVQSLNKQIPFYSERHCIKPGITGWAQVRYEYGDSIEDALEKLRYDLYYIKYQSISLDLLIVLDTIKVIFFGRGGR